MQHIRICKIRIRGKWILAVSVTSLICVERIRVPHGIDVAMKYME